MTTSVADVVQRQEWMAQGLQMLEALSEGYGVEEAAAMVYGDCPAPYSAWKRARRRLHDRLGACTDMQAYRRAVERGFIRVEVRR